MAEVRISGLPTTGSAGLTDELETNTAGGAPSVKRTLAQLLGVQLSDPFKLASGSVSAPSLYLNGETGSGIYRIGANNHGWAISGAKVLDIASTGLGVTGTFSATGVVAFGSGINTGIAVRIQNDALATINQYGLYQDSLFTSAATNSINGLYVSIETENASFTTTAVSGLNIPAFTKGASHTITSAYGVFIGDIASGGTLNAGVRSTLTSGTGKWNIYASGTANNAFNGNVRIGSTTAPTNALDVTGTATVSTQFSAGTSTVVGYIKNRFFQNLTSDGGSNFAVGIAVDGTITSAAGDTTYVAHLSMIPTGTVTGGAGEVHSLITTARFTEPVITLTGADTVTTAATVYIASAPTEGTDNYALVSNGGTLLGTTTGAGNHTRHFISNTFTSGGASTVAYGTRIAGTVTAAAGDTARHVGFIVDPSGMVTQGATEVISVVASAYFAEPIITVGTGDTVTVASTVYINNAPTEGSTNAALYVASGASIFLGNVGVGVTPSAWSSGANWNAIGIAGGATFAGRSTNTEELYLSANAYNDGSWKYIATNFATQYYQDAGTHVWRVAASGTAGNAITWASAMTIDNAGGVFINDTSNANSTIGLTINQGANDNQIFTLKSSDVGTGLTTLPAGSDVETDDFVVFQKASATEGGLRLYVLGESTMASPYVVEALGGDPATTDTSVSAAAFNWVYTRHDGANAVTALSADTNLAAWRATDSGGVARTRMLLKADDGELHLGNTTLVALDGEDDISLVRSMQYAASGGAGMKLEPWENEFGTPAWSYEALHRVGVLGERDENGQCLFRVQPRFAMNEGAIWQLHVRQEKLREQLEQRIEAMTNQLQRLEQRRANPDH